MLTDYEYRYRIVGQNFVSPIQCTTDNTLEVESGKYRIIDIPEGEILAGDFQVRTRSLGGNMPSPWLVSDTDFPAHNPMIQEYLDESQIINPNNINAVNYFFTELENEGLLGLIDEAYCCFGDGINKTLFEQYKINLVNPTGDKLIYNTIDTGTTSKFTTYHRSRGETRVTPTFRDNTLAIFIKHNIQSQFYDAGALFAEESCRIITVGNSGQSEQMQSYGYNASLSSTNNLPSGETDCILVSSVDLGHNRLLINKEGIISYNEVQGSGEEGDLNSMPIYLSEVNGFSGYKSIRGQRLFINAKAMTEEQMGKLSEIIRQTFIIIDNPENTPNNAYFFGDSTTQGYSAESGVGWVLDNYVNVVSNEKGYTPFNMGFGSGRLVGDANTLGLSNIYITDIPQYNASNDKLLSFSFGINDGASLASSTIESIYNTVIEHAISAKGWPSNKILLMPPFWTNNGANWASFISTVEAIAIDKSTLFIDVNTWMQNNGGASLLSDQLHPTEAGYSAIGNYISSQLI